MAVKKISQLPLMMPASDNVQCLPCEMLKHISPGSRADRFIFITLSLQQKVGADCNIN